MLTSPKNQVMKSKPIQRFFIIFGWAFCMHSKIEVTSSANKDCHFNFLDINYKTFDMCYKRLQTKKNKSLDKKNYSLNIIYKEEYTYR